MAIYSEKIWWVKKNNLHLCHKPLKLKLKGYEKLSRTN